MRLAVTGREGQVARALVEAGPTLGIEVVAAGRPDLDLALPETVLPALSAARPDIVVNAAAYTAVDQAETEPEQANAVNGTGAGAVAVAARALGLPVIHLSTDYVFDGEKATPYTEEDPAAPATVYGRTKLAGEKAVAAASPDHAILRTAWVYSPHGKNFVRTMLALAANRNEVRVVADQWGCPTYAPDIAMAILTVARNLLNNPGDSRLLGIFHLAGSGETTWAEFAEAVFDLNAAKGGHRPAVIPIRSVDYPTPARRPKNSRLDCTKLARVHGVQLPEWRMSLRACLDRLTRGVSRLE
jgi:dTDP-4-dehydrorhamnose reductase